MSPIEEDIYQACAKAQVDLGLRLRSLRKAEKLSIAKLASISGVNHSVLGDIERGRGNPRFATLFKLSQSLGIELEQLFNSDASALNEGDPSRKIR